MSDHLSFEELMQGIDTIREAPRDGGRLDAIVVRPATEQRQSLTQCILSPEAGVTGDNWALGCWKSLPDGRPHPDVQVAIMNSRAIQLIARERNRWELAGDNLYVDLNLSDDNLPCGQQFELGTALLQVTEVAHNGCGKFAERFGPDAVKFVNSRVGKELHLRGIYARIVREGVVSVGDQLRKYRSGEAS